MAISINGSVSFSYNVEAYFWELYSLSSKRPPEWNIQVWILSLMSLNWCISCCKWCSLFKKGIWSNIIKIDLESLLFLKDIYEFPEDLAEEYYWGKALNLLVISYHAIINIWQSINPVNYWVRSKIYRFWINFGFLNSMDW